MGRNGWHHFGMVAFLFVLWIVGGAGAGVLNVVVSSDNPRIVRAGRVAFALLLAADLFAGAVVFAVGQGGEKPLTTQSMWWLFALAGGVPLAFVSGLLVRRGYTGRAAELWTAVLVTALVWLAFPLGFIAAGQPHTGLGAWEHNHHAADVVVLLIPTLILLGAEALRGLEPTDQPSLPELLRGAPRTYVVGVAIVLLTVLWLGGANGLGFLLGMGVLLLGGGLFLGLRSHTAVQRTRRDLTK